LRNRADDDFIIRADAFPLLIDEEEIAPSHMDDIRDLYYPDWDYPGQINGQKLEPDEDTESILVYEVPEIPDQIILNFNTPNQHDELILSLETDPDPETEPDLIVVELTPTLTPLESAALDVPHVTRLRLVSVNSFGDGWFVYMEVDTEPGFNNQQTADALRQVSYTVLASAQIEFDAILWDGEGPAIDWIWNNQSDAWLKTELNTTPGPD
jgi:hypothetical protein